MVRCRMSRLWSDLKTGVIAMERQMHDAGVMGKKQHDTRGKDLGIQAGWKYDLIIVTRRCRNTKKDECDFLRASP